MIDPKRFRTELSVLEAALARRGFVLDTELWKKLEDSRKTLQSESEDLQRRRNQQAKKIGQMKARGESIDEVREESLSINNRLNELATELQTVQADLQNYYAGIPNVPDDSIPDGKSEDDNIEIRRWGEPTTFEFDFPPRDHVALGELSGLLDFESAAKITGARFSVLKGSLAQLHRALISFMINLHTGKHGYTEVYVPYLVNAESLQGTGQLPKFEADLFKTSLQGGDKSAHDWYLIPTGEVPVTNLVRGQILEESQLPVRYVSHTPCFRSEAGSYGKDTRGLIRQHQFEKVEMVQVVKAEDSDNQLEALTGHAEAVLQALELPYRVVSLCAGDIGFSSRKTYDLEVWLPGSQSYREISSCSNFGDFQARRMSTRWRAVGQKKNALVHTLNGSGLAVGRTLLAIMENYQQANGQVKVPTCLQPFMNGCEVI